MELNDYIQSAIAFAALATAVVAIIGAKRAKGDAAEARRIATALEVIAERSPERTLWTVEPTTGSQYMLRYLGSEAVELLSLDEPGAPNQLFRLQSQIPRNLEHGEGALFLLIKAGSFIADRTVAWRWKSQSDDVEHEGRRTL